MGGVDLLDSLTALYKARIKTRRWYIYIFYHTINMAIVTAWLLYRRHCGLFNERAIADAQLGQDKTPEKIKAPKLSDFISDVADALVRVERRPGRPSLEEAQQHQQQPAEVRPSRDVRLDCVNHWPDYSTRQLCKLKECKQKTFIRCAKCAVHLCLNKERNCFLRYHTK